MEIIFLSLINGFEEVVDFSGKWWLFFKNFRNDWFLRNFCEVWFVVDCFNSLIV